METGYTGARAWDGIQRRRRRHPETTAQVANLLRRQKGRCAYCGLFFRSGDMLEQDHVIPRAQGGADTLTNLQLLHRHCHDRKTAMDKFQTDILQRRGGTNDNSPQAEEPCEVNASSTVLETSRSGDRVT